MSTINIQFPIKYFEDNLIFNTQKDECCAVYKLVGFGYDFRSNDSKIRILNKLTRFMSNIGEEAQILMIPISQDIDSHYNRLKKCLKKSDPLYNVALGHATHTAAYLNPKIIDKSTGREIKKEEPSDYSFYVITKIKLKQDIIKDIKEFFKYFVHEPVQSVQEFFALDAIEIMESKIASFQRLATDYLNKQDVRLALDKVSEYEIQFLIRRPMFRGLGEFQLRGDEENLWTPFVENTVKNGQQMIRPDSRQVLTLMDGEMCLDESRTFKVEHTDGRTSYQAFLAVTDIPPLRFPGGEWFLLLQDYPINTEVCIKINTIEHNASIKNITKKRKEIKDQIEHIAENDESVPEDLADSMDYTDELEAELKPSKSPMIHASIYICIYDDNKESLEKNVSFIKGILVDDNFMVERPLSDQMALFMEFLPGTQRYLTDYIQKLPPRTLCGGMIGATRVLGDNLGPYIGTTGDMKKKVFLDVSRACRVNRSASGVFVGTLGGGKSFNANLLLYLAVMYGGKGLILDPKGDRGDWKKDLPELKDQINIITLSSSEEYKGTLDPYYLYKNDLEQASWLAISIISEMYGISSKDDEYLILQEVTKWVKKQENPCMLKVAQKLLEFDDDDEILTRKAHLLGRKVNNLKDMAMAALLLGDGTQEERALSFDKKINIIQIQNLVLPDPKKPKETYTPEEVLSTVLMIPVASFADRFNHMDRSYFKCTLFDEAWALKSTSSGRQMMSKLVREGRALNAGCFFITQSIRDIDDEEIKPHISYKFCFKATDNKEITAILDTMDLDCTEENMDVIRNLENGQCLFQDLDGRTGVLQFDAVFEHLILNAFNTNPEKVINSMSGE
ncbi:ATP-binding protein [Clostridium sp. 19966]|uniref:ATP-binding protein n=1 Tax=Clostridium sp. 19966 TaxID=2768166 RepID=UPI0028DD6A59|nr:ATP-binding protein [Clostridium sp. 19966]MDT8718216.1 ATP-binding protein [Clostridium sp. 19966]